MKRKFKNAIAIGVLSISVAAIGGTMYMAKSQSAAHRPAGNPPSLPNQTQQGQSGSDSSSNSNTTTQLSTSKKKIIPSKKGAAPGNRASGLSIGYYVAFAAESFVLASSAAYLLISKGSKVKVKDVMKNHTKKIAVTTLCIAAVTAAATAGEGYVTKNYLVQAAGPSAMGQAPGNMGQAPGNGQAPGGSSSSSTVTATGKTTVTKSKKLSGTYTATKKNQSAILVKKGTATITKATVKKSGNATSTESAEFKGVNSGILVTGGTAKISNSKITTTGTGSNAVFATGTSSKIYISNSTISTTGSRSARGLDATYGGTIIGKNLKITTKGGSCATLATDRGEGTVTVNKATLTTNGSGSPIIYSTGKITLSNATGKANGSQAVVIEGKNSATINNTTITASGKGNRGSVDASGVMIYQSMSGDAASGKGTFTAKNSTVSIAKSSSVYKTAPMFFITNTSAVINLTNTKLSFGSGVLLNAKGTSAWGQSGSNGGNVTLNATNQTLTGEVKADKISTVTINLKNSTYKGKINSSNKAKKVTLKLDKNSKITLTGNTYVTSLSDADSTYSNINFNGYKLYVNGKAIN